MTQEEKAKAYDEALTKAKIHINCKGIGDTVNLCIYLFPELAESEDEKIRKELIEALKTSKNVGELKFVLPYPTREECIAYLEKQKEQKHPDGCFTCDEYKKGYEEGRRNGFTAGYNKAMKEVEQKEQKPVVTLGETYHVDTLGTQQVIAGKMPQKPAEWSEDDEEMLNSCISSIEESKENRYAYKENDGDTSYDREITFMKSLPQRFNLPPKQKQNDYITPHKEFFKFIYDRLINVHKENPNVDYMRSFKERLNNLSFGEKQEWSEEDEKMLQSIIKDFRAGKVSTIGQEQWLKSLRPSKK